jgi:hypothetical protein
VKAFEQIGRPILLPFVSGAPEKRAIGAEGARSHWNEPFSRCKEMLFRTARSPSRARRCWARRSASLMARTVLRGYRQERRRGENLAKDAAKKWPHRAAPPTDFRPAFPCGRASRPFSVISTPSRRSLFEDGFVSTYTAGPRRRPSESYSASKFVLEGTRKPYDTSSSRSIHVSIIEAGTWQTEIIGNRRGSRLRALATQTRYRLLSVQARISTQRMDRRGFPSDQ